jgi:hypothetical protein
MNYKIKTYPQDYYLQIVVFGEIQKDSDADAMQSEIIKLMQNNSLNTNLILIDIQGLEKRASIANSFFRASSVPIEIKNLRIALLERKEYEAHAKAYETMYRNSGTNLMVFFDKYKAEEWLSSLRVLGFS